MSKKCYASINKPKNLILQLKKQANSTYVHVLLQPHFTPAKLQKTPGCNREMHALQLQSKFNIIYLLTTKV